MGGTLKVELSGQTKEELKRQLEEVIRELDKISFRPGFRFNLSGPQAWKVAGAPQAWKVVAGPQAWKVVESQQLPKLARNPRSWMVTYET
jgi:hypothetical protein